MNWFLIFLNPYCLTLHYRNPKYITVCYTPSLLPCFLRLHHLHDCTWINRCIPIVFYSKYVYISVTMVTTRRMAAAEADPTTPPSVNRIDCPNNTFFSILLFPILQPQCLFYPQCSVLRGNLIGLVIFLISLAFVCGAVLRRLKICRLVLLMDMVRSILINTASRFRRRPRRR